MHNRKYQRRGLIAEILLRFGVMSDKKDKRLKKVLSLPMFADNFCPSKKPKTCFAKKETQGFRQNCQDYQRHSLLLKKSIV